MSFSLYDAVVPSNLQILGAIDALLDKAEAFCADQGRTAAELIDTRLAPDMLPFTAQVQIACDGAKFAMARLGDVEAPKFDDSEASLAELRERVRATIDFIKSVPASKIDGTEDKDITIPRRSGPVVMKGEAYLKHYVLSNFFFHVTTTYALLRHNGVELGKTDYLGAPKA